MFKYRNAPRDLLQGWVVVAIDDHPPAFEVIDDILSFYGADVHTAVNGQEGLELIRQLRPRFVISDVSMPVMDGWELIAEVKADPLLRQIPIIALTAHAMKGDRERAIAQGFHNYLAKPLDPFKFLSQILILLEDIEDIQHDLQQKLSQAS